MLDFYEWTNVSGYYRVKQSANRNEEVVSSDTAIPKMVDYFRWPVEFTYEY